MSEDIALPILTRLVRAIRLTVSSRRLRGTSPPRATTPETTRNLDRAIGYEEKSERSHLWKCLCVLALCDFT